jgi:lipid II:glycine glycyltransferase (peptidoglycan interpeptide bridge formation enzyme)
MKSNYSVLEYDRNVVETFPLSFQSFYVEYVNRTLHGRIFLFETNGEYICFVVRKKFGCTFVHLISEIYSVDQTAIDFTLFYLRLEHYFRLIRAISVFPPQHLHTYQQAPISAIKHTLGIIQLDLSTPIDTLFKNLKTVYRRHIKSAQKEGVEVEFGHHLFEEFYQFYQTRMQYNKASYDSKSNLKKIITDAPEKVVCAIARLNGTIEAVILNIHDTTTAFYMWGASGIDAHNGSFRLLHWEIIKYYHSIGITNYSLGGHRLVGQKTKKQENLENFKLGFGAVIKDGVHFKWVLKPFHSYLYQKIIKVVQLFRP